MGKLSVGQQLWCVQPDRRDGAPRWVTVTAVGRKWATIDGRRRVDASTLASEPTGFGHGVHGIYYRTKEEWEVEQERRVIWRTIRDNIDYAPPDDISTAAIYQAAALLGIELPARSDTGEAP